MKIIYQDFWEGYEEKSFLNSLLKDEKPEKSVAVIAQSLTDTPPDIPVVFLTNEPYLFSDWKDEKGYPVLLKDVDLLIPYQTTLEDMLYLRMSKVDGYHRTFLKYFSPLKNEYIFVNPDLDIEKFRKIGLKPHLTISHFSTSDTNIQIRNYERLHLEIYKNTKVYSNLPNFQETKDKFCCFVVRNPIGWERLEFFDLLNSYKKVDSLGRVKRNVNFSIVPYRPYSNDFNNQYLRHLSTYKFMICFEHEYQPYFLTEKLYNAMRAGVIPIYFGTNECLKVFNSESFIFVEYKNTVDEQREEFRRAMEKVIELDQDDEKYQQMLNQPYVLDVDQKNEEFASRINLIKERILNLDSNEI